MTYLFKEQIMGLFTSEESVIAAAMTIIWMLSFNVFPDCFKGMLKGVIKALGIQSKVIPLNLTGHWGINLTLQWYLGLHLNMGIQGLWIAKLILEWYIFGTYFLLVSCQDWAKISQKSVERLERERAVELAFRGEKDS